MRLRTVSPSEWAQLRATEPYLRWGIDPGDPPAAWRPADPADRSGLVALSRRRRTAGPRSLSFVQLRPEVGAGSDSRSGSDTGSGSRSGSVSGSSSGSGSGSDAGHWGDPAPDPGAGIPHSRSQPDTKVAELLAEMAAELIPVVQAGGLTVPRALAVPVHAALSARLPSDDPGGAPEGIGWDWMWIDHRLPATAHTRAAAAVPPGVLENVTLDVADPLVVTEIQTLLDDASPRHSAEPGDPRVRRWFGVQEVSPPPRHPQGASAGGPAGAGAGGPAGALVACAAWYESVPGVPMLASVAVRADRRGAGLGVALMVAVSEAAFDAGCPAVTVDLYADNPVARNLYRSLGFQLEQEFASWWLGRQHSEAE